MTPNDKKILDYLSLPKEARAEHAEAYTAIVSTALMALRPDLIRLVQSWGRLEDVEAFVDDMILDAFESFRDQYLGKDVSMPFDARCSNRVDDLLKGWMLAMIGKPFAGVRSGKVTNAIRKQDNKKKAQHELPAQDVLEGNETCAGAEAFIEAKEVRANIEALLKKLPPKKEFVFRVNTGLHGFDHLSPTTLSDIAQASRLDKRDCRYIKAMANDILDNAEAGPHLDQRRTGKLVMIQERQVRNILSEVRKKIKEAEWFAA